MDQWQHRTVIRDGINLATRRRGDPGRPAVLCVHGYPDNGEVWDALADALGDRFQVITYDVRGAGASSAPAPVAAYRLAELRDDLFAVIDALSPDRPVHLVAHDWGSIQSWEPVTEPGAERRIASFTTLSGPCLDHVGQSLRRRGAGDMMASLRQLAKSWYIGAFHLPALAPLAWKLGLADAWPGILRRTEGLEAAASPTQSQDGARGVALYRANMLPCLLHPRERRTTIPVQLIVATRDRYVAPGLLDGLSDWTGPLWRREMNTGHWGPLLGHAAVTADYLGEFIDHIEGAPESARLARARVRPNAGPDAGKLVVITGAGSGIGRETALAFGGRGATVLCTDIDPDSAAATAEAVRAAGGEALSRKTDVANARSMEALARYVERELGAPDVVVNNAGIGLAGPLLDTSVQDWKQVLDVNLWGVIHGCRLFGRQMIDQVKAGHIVNVSSASAYLPSRALPAYATSKSAVLMLTECLRAELADRGIGVSAICPGLIDTPITGRARFVGVDEEEQGRRRQAAQRLYHRRGFTPDRVARAIVDAVRDNRAEVPVSMEASGMRWLGRLAPPLARRLARVDVERLGANR
ncbi:SDR family oxidoreductase [Alloalcanivorax gelatiniphagus]|uniref:SDR family oxidoreductase n=3 Tax=Alloalcanivorax gelatiniphagus TaxID=1194167 RepID=A0ABY2XJ62_9GAMM|nr:SDR family oxidoreductase [Alloalcanivorax gelatiniphagus]TMW11455.1 SDR family oxidoreductase [Alloalcanivorax gelatiniphagus]|tara:strand:- start:563 stop:2314 length:1752 start_codon:yes stop_codon:yes gene_type:complete